MRINNRDVTLTDDEITILKSLRALGLSEITYRDEDVFIWHCGNYEIKGGCVNAKMLDGFDWIKNGERLVIGKLIYESEKPKTVWELEKSDKYCVLNEYGNVIEYTWRDDDVDKKLRRQGNAFLTKEEAEFEAKRREVVTKVRKYARPFKCGRNQYIPCYDHNSEKIGKYCVGFNQENVDHFDTQEDIYKAVEEVGEEDFKKYYFGVTE